MAPGQQPNSQGLDFKVTGQQPTTALGPDGRAARGFEVMFETGRGLAGSVFVPMERYTPENVRAQISDLVARMHGVADL